MSTASKPDVSDVEFGAVKRPGSRWTQESQEALIKAVLECSEHNGNDASIFNATMIIWHDVAARMKGVTSKACRSKWSNMQKKAMAEVPGARAAVDYSQLRQGTHDGGELPGELSGATRKEAQGGGQDALEWQAKAACQQYPMELPEGSVESLEARTWLRDTRTRAEWRKSMPPNLALQLLHDPLFLPGARPRKFTPASGIWVFKEFPHERRNALWGERFDRWHSCGASNGRDVPRKTPVVRRRYGQIERAKVPVYSYHMYSALTPPLDGAAEPDSPCKTDASTAISQSSQSNNLPVIYHVMTRRAESRGPLPDKPESLVFAQGVVLAEPQSAVLAEPQPATDQVEPSDESTTQPWPQGLDLCDAFIPSLGPSRTIEGLAEQAGDPFGLHGPAAPEMMSECSSPGSSDGNLSDSSDLTELWYESFGFAPETCVGSDDEMKGEEELNTYFGAAELSSDSELSVSSDETDTKTDASAVYLPEGCFLHDPLDQTDLGAASSTLEYVGDIAGSDVDGSLVGFGETSSASGIAPGGSKSLQARIWVKETRAERRYRASMPAGLALQLLTDSLYQPGRRPSQFFPAAGQWIFKEKHGEQRSKCMVDRWHSSGKSYSDVPRNEPIVRRRYGQIEHQGKATFAYHVYTTSTPGDRTILYHVIERRQSANDARKEASIYGKKRPFDCAGRDSAADKSLPKRKKSTKSSVGAKSLAMFALGALALCLLATSATKWRPADAFHCVGSGPLHSNRDHCEASTVGAECVYRCKPHYWRSSQHPHICSQNGNFSGGGCSACGKCQDQLVEQCKSDSNAICARWVAPIAPDKMLTNAPPARVDSMTWVGGPNHDVLYMYGGRKSASRFHFANVATSFLRLDEDTHLDEDTDLHSDMWYRDVSASARWQQLPHVGSSQVPAPMAGASTWHDTTGALFMFGGDTSRMGSSADLWMYTTGAEVWKQLAGTVESDHSTGAAVDGSVFARYDPNSDAMIFRFARQMCLFLAPCISCSHALWQCCIAALSVRILTWRDCAQVSCCRKLPDWTGKCSNGTGRAWADKPGTLECHVLRLHFRRTRERLSPVVRPLAFHMPAAGRTSFW
eukprot:SAG11_NODE_1122_length_5788_cov_7.564423_3_plen_1085_part_00